MQEFSLEAALDNSHPEIQEAIETSRDRGIPPAIEQFEAFLKNHPTHIGAMGHLAYLQELRDRPDLALPIYQRICELAPDYPVARHRLAECHFSLGDYRKARFHYLKLQGTPFLENEKVIQRLALCEPLLLRFARQAPQAMGRILGKCGRPGFLLALARELLSSPGQSRAIREVGLSGYLSYLNRHFIRTEAWRDPKNPCDLCGSDRFQTVFFYLDQKVVRCQGCGLETVERKPVEGIDVQTGYYDEDSTIDRFVSQGWQDEKLLDHRMNLLRALFDQAGASYPQPEGRAFEVGFGQGHFLKEIEKLGYQVEGIETAPKLVRFAREQLGIRSEVGTVETIQEARGPVDLFLAYHVLEHVDFPSRLFLKANRLLSEGGYLVVETPVSELSKMPFSKKMDEAIGYANYHHLHFFTVSHVRQFYRKHGFEVVGEYLLYPDTHPTGGFLGRKKESI